MLSDAASPNLSVPSCTCGLIVDAEGQAGAFPRKQCFSLIVEDVCIPTKMRAAVSAGTAPSVILSWSSLILCKRLCRGRVEDDASTCVEVCLKPFYAPHLALPCGVIGIYCTSHTW